MLFSKFYIIIIRDNLYKLNISYISKKKFYNNPFILLLKFFAIVNKYLYIFARIHFYYFILYYFNYAKNLLNIKNI